MSRQKNAPQLLAQFEALTGSISLGQNQYEHFNGIASGVQRGYAGAAR
jgi:hypothetical protein